MQSVDRPGPVNNHSDEISSPNADKTILSKSQMKKLTKRQQVLASRPEKRRIEKEKKRQKKLDIAQKLANGELVLPTSKPTAQLMSESTNKFKIVIDMDFAEFMTEEELSKAAKQVSRIYATNRKSENPCQLYISSVTGKIRDRFSKTCTGYTNWDVNISDKPYYDLFRNDNEIYSSDISSDSMRKMIYLTGDSADNLPDVPELLQDETQIFVIGGLVDHNRHKNLCLNRAKEISIKTAKLPIKENVILCDRHILSTFTVFEIMLRVLGSGKSWKEVFLESIPSRKIDQKIRKNL